MSLLPIALASGHRKGLELDVFFAEAVPEPYTVVNYSGSVKAKCSITRLTFHNYCDSETSLFGIETTEEVNTLYGERTPVLKGTIKPIPSMTRAHLYFMHNIPITVKCTFGENDSKEFTLKPTESQIDVNYTLSCGSSSKKDH